MSVRRIHTQENNVIGKYLKLPLSAVEVLKQEVAHYHARADGAFEAEKEQRERADKAEAELSTLRAQATAARRLAEELREFRWTPLGQGRLQCLCGEGIALEPHEDEWGSHGLRVIASCRPACPWEQLAALFPEPSGGKEDTNG